MEFVTITYYGDYDYQERLAKKVEKYVENLGHSALRRTVHFDEYYSWGEYPVISFRGTSVRIEGDTDIEAAMENGSLADFLNNPDK